jgi:hypothetical protein
VPQDFPLVVAMLEGVFWLFPAMSIFLIASFPPLTTLSAHYCAVSASFGMTYSLQYLPQDKLDKCIKRQIAWTFLVLFVF